jgi:hypothetical protein
VENDIALTSSPVNFGEIWKLSTSEERLIYLTEKFSKQQRQDGHCSYPIINGPSRKFCGRPNLDGFERCYWHAKSKEKYDSENIKKHFGRDTTLIEEIESAAAEGSLYGAYLVDAKLGSNTYATGSRLESTDLRFADFTNAKLSYCDLRSSCVRGANFRNAELTGADLSKAKVSEACFHNAKFSKTKLEATEGFTMESFRNPDDLISSYTCRSDSPENKRKFYRDLVKLFTNEGSVDDLSWACFNERVAHRQVLIYNLNPLNSWFNKTVTGALSPSDFPARKHAVMSRLLELPTNIFQAFTSLISEFTFGYGERPVRALACSGTIIVLFALLFWSHDSVSNVEQVSTAPAIVQKSNSVLPDRPSLTSESNLKAAPQKSSFGASLQFSFFNFVRVPTPQLSISASNQVWAQLEATLGILLMGLFVFSSSRRASSR